MKRTTAVRMLLLGALLLVALAAPGWTDYAVGTGGGTTMPAAPSAMSMPMTPQMLTPAAMTFAMQVHRLWADHVIYTRCVIIDLAAGIPADGDLARLMKNQEDLGNALKPYYGDAAGDKLTMLLKTHIAQAGDVVMAAKAGDAVKLKAAQDAWYANADEIALFLSGANPRYWPQETMKAAMKKHLDTTTAEAVARLQGRWRDDTAAFDAAFDHILMMAGVISSGIIQQFPDKFAAPPMP